MNQWPKRQTQSYSYQIRPITAREQQNSKEYLNQSAERTKNEKKESLLEFLRDLMATLKPRVSLPLIISMANLSLILSIVFYWIFISFTSQTHYWYRWEPNPRNGDQIKWPKRREKDNGIPSPLSQYWIVEQKGETLDAYAVTAQTRVTIGLCDLGAI